MKALILVDLQYDFMPGGALAVDEGDQIVEVANRLGPHFDFVVATQDWHPADHGSFASQHDGETVGNVIRLGGVDQILWPDHCIQETQGARFHRDLNREQLTHIVPKGTDRLIDSYSGFFDNDHQKSTGLGPWLKDQNVAELAVMGLATDYCVKFTALDAITLGFATDLIVDGCRGVNLNPDDSKLAIEEMKEAGVRITTSDDWIKNLSKGN